LFDKLFSLTRFTYRDHERHERRELDLDSSTHSPLQATDPAPSGTGERAAARGRGEQQALHDRLWENYRRSPGDESRNRLVESYQYLVGDIVRRFALRLPRSVERGDLETAANVGLMSAIGGFDASRGVPFELYCEVRVRGALLDELRHQDWLPRPWRQRMERQKRAIEALRSELGREPADEEVAESMGLEVAEYQQIFGTGLLSAPAGSMSSDGGDSDGGGILEEVCDPSLEPLSDQLTREEIMSLVADRLTEQEYRLIYLRYWEDLSMREIGELCGLSESRVCKIHARLIERLRERFQREGS